MKIDKEKIEIAIKMLLEAIGENPDREGLVDTPARVARMYEEVTAGYQDEAKQHLKKTFQVSGSDMVIERDIAFSSTCEHHLMPFFGKVHIAYIPDGNVVGLSKLARVVDTFSRRLQLQERMNSEIADAIFEQLSPNGVIVIVEAEHTCMTSRGVKKIGSKTISYAERGNISSEIKTQILLLTSSQK